MIFLSREAEGLTLRCLGNQHNVCARCQFQRIYKYPKMRRSGRVVEINIQSWKKDPSLSIREGFFYIRMTLEEGMYI